MSQAFVREGEEQWLHEIPPTLSALINFLTRENNGVRVYEKSKHMDETRNREVYVMSNGSSYSHDEEGKWYVER